MKCAYCSTDNAPDDIFCSGCGSPLREVRQPERQPKPELLPITDIQCPHCGKTHPSHISNCPETGGDLPLAGSEAWPIVATNARFVLSDGSEITLTSAPRSLGRYDFDRFVSVQDLSYISKKHLIVTYEDNTYNIEDISKNGTLLNGTEIKGSGKQGIKNGDQIELGKVVSLLFRLS